MTIFEKQLAARLAKLETATQAVLSLPNLSVKKAPNGRFVPFQYGWGIDRKN